jgi:hypothetical protein
MKRPSTSTTQLSPEYLKMRAEFEKHPPSVTVKGLPEGTPMRIEDKLDLKVPNTGKKVKHVFIEATFPELKGGQMYQHAHGEASGTKPAIARAFKNLLKTIPKKRISVISAKISITTKTLEG